MIESPTSSIVKRVAIACGLLLVAFAFGALIGYVRGVSGDDGSTERAIDWAVKTGLLGILLIIVSTIFGKVEVFVETNWKIPFLASFSLMIGLVFAIMDGSSVLMEIEQGEFWLSVLSGFGQGVLGGGIAGIFIQKTEVRSDS